MALALIHLFYDSAGGVLILLGNLLKLLPHPDLPTGSGGSSLPIFQRLEDNMGVVLFRSLASAILCSTAFVILVSVRRQERRLAWLVAASCIVAALLAGHGAGIALVPAIAVSLLRLVSPVLL